MKRILIIFVLLLTSVFVFGQENIFTLSGGYAFTNIEETDVTGKGWRINALYEINPSAGKWAHGFSFGFVRTTADYIEGLNTSSYNANNWPVYYAPKFFFTEGLFKGFVKGALGVHFSSIERSGALGSLIGNDFGLAAGGGLGMMYSLNEKLFFNAEYELLWMSNSYYGEGLLNTAGIGVGIKF
jgi:hypothetical protein